MKARSTPVVLAWWVLTLAVGVAVAGFATELGTAMDRLGTAEPRWLLAAVVLNLAGPVFQARAWHHFLPRDSSVSRSRLLETAGAMAAVANSVPLLMGGLATGVQLLATRGGVGHSRALAVAALDQLAEGVAKVALLVTVLVWAPIPLPGQAVGGVFVVGVAGLGLGLLWARRRDAGGSGILARWARSLDALDDPGRLARGMGFILATKAAEVLAVVAVLQALAPELPAWGSALALLAVNLATIVGLTPGNLGIYEGAAFAAWTLAGAEAETALSLALAQHGAYLAASLGGGWLLATFAGRDPGLEKERGPPGP